VGSAQTASGHDHAFSYDLFRKSGMVDLGTLGGTSSIAYGAQNGLIVGASQTTGDARTRAFSYPSASGTMEALAFDWGGDSVALDVAFDNDGNAVVGYACTANNASCHAFLFRGNSATDLGSFGGNSAASAVNDAGQVAGTSALADGTKHAFLFANGGL